MGMVCKTRNPSKLAWDLRRALCKRDEQEKREEWTLSEEKF